MNRSTRNVLLNDSLRASLKAKRRRARGAPPVPCTSCTRPTDEPRGGRCSACYQRTRRGHVAAPACAVCATTDRRVLRRHKLACGVVTLCANDSAVAGRRLLTLDQLRAEVIPAGDRRGPTRRRADRRGPSERRTRLDVAWLLDGDRHAAPRRAAERQETA